MRRQLDRLCVFLLLYSPELISGLDCSRQEANKGWIFLLDYITFALDKKTFLSN